MAIINVTGSNTISFSQLGFDEGTRNPQWTALLGNRRGTLGENLLPGRAELYEYTSQLGKEITSGATLAVGLFGVPGLSSIVPLTSIPGIENAVPAEGFTLGLGGVLKAGVEIPLTASNTITFTQTNAYEKFKPLTGSGTLVFTQQALRGGSLSYTASSSVAFSQSQIAAVPKPLSASNSLVLSQGSTSGLLTRTANNVFVPNQSIAVGGILELTASSLLLMTQSAAPGLLSRTAHNAFLLQQTTFDFTVGEDSITLTASDTLFLSQSNNRFIVFASAFARTASDTLTLVQRGIFPVPLTAKNSISFNNSSSANAGKSVTQTLDLVQTVILNQVRSITASSVFDVQHSFTWVQFRDGLPLAQLGPCGATRQYSPFQGGDGSPPLRSIGPSLERKTDVEFFSPAGGICDATESLTLRTPNFGDRDRNQYNRINRESRGGSLRIFRDPKWPKERTLIMDFSGVKDSEVDLIIDFLNDTLGQKVGFRDWRGQVWFGIITNPDTAIVRTGKANLNDVVIELEVDDRLLELNGCNAIEFTQSNAVVLVPAP